MILLRRLTFWLALIGIGSATVLALRSRASFEQPVPPPPVTPPPRPSPRGIAASGIVEAKRENTNIGLPLPGLVGEVLVRVWDDVKVGQPLLRLDDRELQAALASQRARVKVAEATTRRIDDQLRRLETLAQRDSSALTLDDLDTRRNDLAVARAELDVALATVRETEQLIDRLTVRAPIAGTILQVNTRAGEYANPNSSRPPLVLGDIRDVQVRADVDEQIAPRVKQGKDAIGYLKGDTTRPIEMKFVRIEPFVVPKQNLTGGSAERVDTRVLQAIFTFPNHPRHPVYVGQQMDLYIQE